MRTYFRTPLLIFAFTFLASTASAQWVNQHLVDELTGQATDITSLISNEDEDAFLLLRCTDSDTFEMAVFWGRYLDADPKIPVTYKFGENDLVQNASWIASTDGQATFAKPPRRKKWSHILRPFIESDRFVLRGMDYQNTPYTLTFDANNTTAAVLPILKECRRRLDFDDADYARLDSVVAALPEHQRLLSVEALEAVISELDSDVDLFLLRLMSHFGLYGELSKEQFDKLIPDEVRTRMAEIAREYR